MNKRAQEQVMWTNLIGVFVVGVLIVAMSYASYRLFSSANSGPETGAIDNFKGLVFAVDDLVNPKTISYEDWAKQNNLLAVDDGKDPDMDGFSNREEYAAKTDPNNINDKPGEKVQTQSGEQTTPQEKSKDSTKYPLSLQIDYGLVGFDSSSPIVKENCLKNDDLPNKACLKMPCLCLYKLPDKPILCEPLDNVRYISRKTGGNFDYSFKHSVVTGANQLVIWNDCGITWAGMGTRFGTRMLNIVKTQAPNGEFDLTFDVEPSIKT